MRCGPLQVHDFKHTTQMGAGTGLNHPLPSTPAPITIGALTTSLALELVGIEEDIVERRFWHLRSRDLEKKITRWGVKFWIAKSHLILL